VQDYPIVAAVSRDLRALAPLFDAYRAFFAGAPNIDESRRFLAERFELGDATIFRARGDDSDAAGFIQLYPLWSSWYCRRVWFLSDLYVREANRGLGIGRRLVERAVTHAQQTGASSVIVELPRREPHLSGFYADLGFHKDGVFDLARRSFPA
jgi:GNAT superfamily N-acetyltransferase